MVGVQKGKRLSVADAQELLHLKHCQLDTMTESVSFKAFQTPDDNDSRSENELTYDREAAENEDAWTGFSSGNEGKVHPVIDQEENDINRVPSRAEIRVIQEASELYKSNSFKLQVEALLPHVRPGESRVRSLEVFLRKLHSILMSLPAEEARHPLDGSRALLKQGVSVPFITPLPTEDVKWKVSFEKPSDVLLIGSWAVKTSVKRAGKPEWIIDVAVEMPSCLFQEKDYLDGRFFQKRAYYVASLASALKVNCGLDVDVHYGRCSSDARLTSVVLSPRTSGTSIDFSSPGSQIRLLPVLPSQSPISLHHLSPEHCNIRLKTENTLPIVKTPTPLYNNDLMKCATARLQLLQIHEVIQKVPFFRDALTLLRVWANQRGYNPGNDNTGCIAGFESRGYFWPALLAGLILGEEDIEQKAAKNRPRRTLGKGLSSYQLFRAALEFLASHDFSQQPFFQKGALKFSPNVYKTHSEAFFIDSSSVNVLSGVPLSSLDLLRHEAKVTLNSLDSNSEFSDAFNDAFLRTRRQLLSRFDVVLRVDLRRASLRHFDTLAALDASSPSQYLIQSVCRITRRALGDRAIAIAVLVPTVGVRPLNDLSLPVPVIHIGLLLNQANAFRLVDHGPAASGTASDEVKGFREFWGSKAELRRFKDGLIFESVVWEVKSSDQRTRIPSLIVEHVLGYHLGLVGQRDVQTLHEHFDRLLQIPESIADVLRRDVVSLGFKSAIAAFDRLVKILKSLDDELPLAILNVSPASSDLRYTSVFAPVGFTTQTASILPDGVRYLSAIEIVLQFEKSGRWPDDLRSIQNIKLALFEQIANALMKKSPGLQASVVVEKSRHLGFDDSAHLEIITQGGWCFAARIWHDREAVLLDRLLDDKVPGRTNDAQNASDANSKAHASEAQRLYFRRFIHSPKHHRAVMNVCHHNPAFPGTVRLAKRWLASHWLLGSHVNDETVELLCAFIFVGDSQNASQPDGQKRPGLPGTKEVGFFRLVSFLKEWKWESGIFVSLYTSSIDEEVGVEATAKPESGPGAWTIKTSADPGGRIWTSQGPSALAARRVKALALSTMNYVQAHEADGFDLKQVFVHPTTDYDILIHLKKDALCRNHHNVTANDPTSRQGTKYANLSSTLSSSRELPRVDFDPAYLFVQDLKRTYTGTMELFFDAYGGSIIGAVWDPSILQARQFRVLAEYSSTPDLLARAKKERDRDNVIVNQSAILAEIQRLGEGLVASIEVQNDRMNKQ